MEETILLYLIIGLAVGAALAWRDPRRAAVWLTLGVLFWPIFLPLLFAKPRRPRRSISEIDSLREEAERLTATLPEVASLTGALARAAEIRSGSEDLARLLAEQETALAADEPSFAKSEKAKELRETRVADLARIRAAQDEQEARYLRIVSRVREAITQAHLARFSEESRRELQKQMARLGDEVSIIGGRES
jgi:CRP-like cAMP-binding protein